MSKERVQVNGVQMGVQRYGHPGGETLVLLHGFTGSAANWAPLFAELAIPDRQLIAIDMLGHGDSDAPVDAERYSMEHCREDIVAVLQQLGIKHGKATLLGYSMGGRIALYCAFSDFFKALILESASAGLADVREREERQRSDTALAESIEREGVAAFVERWEQLPLFASQNILPATTRAALHEQRLHNNPTGLANSLRGVGTGVQPALYERLPELALRVLLITGALDRKFCAIAAEMARLLPNGEQVVVSGAGHTVHLEQPQQFVRIVQAFLAMHATEKDRGVVQ